MWSIFSWIRVHTTRSRIRSHTKMWSIFSWIRVHTTRSRIRSHMKIFSWIRVHTTRSRIRSHTKMWSIFSWIRVHTTRSKIQSHTNTWSIFSWIRIHSTTGHRTSTGIRRSSNCIHIPIRMDTCWKIQHETKLGCRVVNDKEKMISITRKLANIQLITNTK